MDDAELAVVRQALLDIPDFEKRTAAVMRATFDQIYYGQKTGRFRVEQLYKTEKSHIGSLIEINLRREFEGFFQDGMLMDYCVAGVEVDCKFSLREGGWMIPSEARGKVCLLVWAEDSRNSQFSVGLVRASEDALNLGSNKDGKTTLSQSGMAKVQWILRRKPMPPNVLLCLEPEELRRVLDKRAGQARVDEIFRVAEGRRIGRAVVATLAQQEDYMKRVRSNGGSRSRLSPEGFIILGEYRDHRRIAAELGVPVPQDGEFVSVRVRRVGRRETGCTEIAGQYWIRTKEPPSGDKAPVLPKLHPAGRRKN